MMNQQLSKKCVFHSKSHTLDVLKNVEIIGKYCKLKEDEMNTLRLSAIFHDIGYIQTYKGHELESIAMTKSFLKIEQIDDSIIEKISAAIMATRVPQNPPNKLSAILCDADLMHLTYDNYFQLAELLRQEWELCGIASMSKKEFHINSVNFFNAHHYHSKYGRQILQEKKEKTLKRIKAKIS